MKSLEFHCGIIVATLIQLATVHSANIHTEGALTSHKLKPLLDTSTFRYSLSTVPSSVETARQVCHHSHGSLLFLESSEELENIRKSLENLQDKIPLWTSGVRFSNATTENLLIWSSTQEPFRFPLKSSDIDNLHLAYQKRFPVRNRRDANVTIEISSGEDGIIDNDNECPCSCNTNATTTPRPFTPIPCKRPTCQGYRPPCVEKKPRTCQISRPVTCSAQENNCTVTCGRPEDCRVIKPPVCTVINSDKPLCRLELPNLGKCRTTPQNCTIVAPGYCHSLRVDCKQLPSPPCAPSIKPCKKPCSQQECTTTQAPCVTEQPPCVTAPTPTPCPPATAPEDCLGRCKRSTNDKEMRWKCEQTCLTPNPINCTINTTICPPAVTICPPPMTSCTRPFVDCSPILCQSNVQICPPTKIRCPPPTIICEDPQIKCDDPEVECPEPEVICDEPEVKCSRPVVKCPDPVVNCDPVITTCEPAPVSCSDPELECPDPVTSCEEATVCPIQPPENGGGCSCDGKRCGGTGAPKGVNKIKRGILPPDLEFVEKTECIALEQSSGSRDAEWVAQSCNLKHHFICKMQKI